MIRALPLASPSQLLYFQRDLSDRLLDPLRWCGKKYYSQIGSDQGRGAIGRACQLIQKIIARILLMPVIVFSGLLGVVGSLTKVFESREKSPVKNCIIANIQTQDRGEVLRNAYIRLQTPPYVREDHDELVEAADRLIATLETSVPRLLTSVLGSNLPSYPFIPGIREPAKEFILRVVPHLWNQFVYHLSSAFNQDPPRRITDPVSLNYSMFATEEEAAKWRHVLDLILGIPQQKPLRDQAIEMLQLCQKVKLYVSNDLRHFQIISYGAV